MRHCTVTGDVCSIVVCIPGRCQVGVDSDDLVERCRRCYPGNLCQASMAKKK